MPGVFDAAHDYHLTRDSEPWYEAEDCQWGEGCEGTVEDMEWEEDQGCYICSACGRPQ